MCPQIRENTYNPRPPNIHTCILPASVITPSPSLFWLSLSFSRNSNFFPHSSQLLIVSFVVSRMVIEPSLQDESEFLYAAQPELLRYRTPELTVDKVMDWYQTRAEEIEHYARQVRGGDSGSSVPRWGLRTPCGSRQLAGEPGIVDLVCRDGVNVSYYFCFLILCLTSFCGFSGDS